MRDVHSVSKERMLNAHLSSTLYDELTMTILSMTAVGHAQFIVDQRAYTLGLRTVNSKGLDIKASLPEMFTSFEPRIRSEISAHLHRGKVDVRVKLTDLSQIERTLDADDPRSPQARLIEAHHSINWGLLQDLVEIEAQLITRFPHLTASLKTADLMRWPDVINAAPAPSTSSLQAPLNEALSVALGQVLEMRRHEGEQLEQVLRGHCAEVEGILQQIETSIPKLESDRRERFFTRIQSLMDPLDLNLEDPRLLQELALMIEKGDVTEEVDRLKAHLHQMRHLFSSDSSEGIGRRCDFLCQELHREVNTITSKMADASVRHHCVTLKAQIEKLREQLQNIE
jgi:uncharacterized protein (TIGR00255 family)